MSNTEQIIGNTEQIIGSAKQIIGSTEETKIHTKDFVKTSINKSILIIGEHHQIKIKIG